MPLTRINANSLINLAEVKGDSLRVHSPVLSTNVIVDADENAICAGPLEIADGVTLTINGNLTIA